MQITKGRTTKKGINIVLYKIIEDTAENYQISKGQ